MRNLTINKSMFLQSAQETLSYIRIHTKCAKSLQGQVDSQLSLCSHRIGVLSKILSRILSSNSCLRIRHLFCGGFFITNINYLTKPTYYKTRSICVLV
jgi:hypothetical protein